MLSSLLKLPECFEQLKAANKPIVMYGMGDAAQLLWDKLLAMGVIIQDIFASDEFVRGHSFCGKRVKKLAEIEAQYPDFIILLAFAVQDAPTMARLHALSDRYTLYAPDLPVAGEEYFTKAFLKEHLKDFTNAYHRLADEQSKQVFLNVLRYKLTGDIHFLRGTDTPPEDTWSTLLPHKEQEHFVDMGAYNGDTLTQFLSRCGGKFAKAHALEPDQKNFAKMQKRLTQKGLYPDGRIELYNLAAWSEQTTLYFAQKAGRNSKVTTQGKEVLADSVDNLLKGAPATLLKLDVEGSEYEALLGAKHTIQTHRPNIWLSSYHRSDDLFRLPQLIEDICPHYRFYLRKSPYIPAWEVNYICVAEQL